MGERGVPEREPLRQRGGRHMDAAEQLSRLEHIEVVAGDEIHGPNSRGGALRGHNV